MDYKETINRLRHPVFGHPDLKLAADAIETLLAERDAAVEEIRGACGKCKYFVNVSCN